MNTFGNQDFNPYKHLEVGKNPEDLAKDKAYDKKGKESNPEGTKIAQEKAREGLYGVFNPKKDYEQEKIPGNEKSEGEDGVENNSKLEVNETTKKSKIDEKFSENPSYPILKRFDDKKFKEGEVYIIEKKLSEKGENKDILKTLGDISKDLKDNSELKNYISDFISNNEKKSNNKEKSAEQKVELPIEFSKNPFLEKHKDSKVVKLLGENYMEIPVSNGEKSENFKENLDLTFELTVNKIIDGKQFNRSESFEIAMKDIKSNSLSIEDKFYALSYVNSFIQTTEGIKGKNGVSKLNYAKKLEQENNEVKDKYFTEKIKNKIKELPDDIKKLIMSKSPEELLKTKDLPSKVKETLEEIKKLNDERNTGDVFEGGKEDKVSEIVKEEK